MSSILAKRPREEDVFRGLGDRGPKKSRFDRDIVSFPSNPSLAVKFAFGAPSLSSALQPTESAQQHSHIILDGTIPEPFRQWREEKKNAPSSQARRPPTLTLDTAMEVDAAQPSPLPNGDNLSPWPVSAKSRVSSHLQPSPIPHHLLSQSLTISGGRISTPIHSHFTLNMNSELMADSSRPTGTLNPLDESNWWRRRRLPSPISEAGGDSPAEPLHDLENPSKETTDNWPDSPSSMDVDGHAPSTTFLQVPEQNLEGVAAHLPEFPQSNASSLSAVHSETAALNPGPRREKISFSMGYRADCEKCQMKVPGHYSHIVRS
ncbi:hypothetical protein UA08_03865 [Talaromyces atroroseus]|uniref:Uncharacterized protein n=1 Tax=Talaromyces atroroseus TaxID=1441469 RepID=A0A225B6T7_TALAT|nr:hypothetical protein UA08_03865 [Talaromyces atroroseus]OKL61627.1 hypothetical protein UA08_03865 [Talaromyces atroroseus]